MSAKKFADGLLIILMAGALVLAVYGRVIRNDTYYWSGIISVFAINLILWLIGKYFDKE